MPYLLYMKRYTLLQLSSNVLSVLKWNAVQQKEWLYLISCEYSHPNNDQICSILSVLLRHSSPVYFGVFMGAVVQVVVFWVVTASSLVYNTNISEEDATCILSIKVSTVRVLGYTGGFQGR